MTAPDGHEWRTFYGDSMQHLWPVVVDTGAVAPVEAACGRSAYRFNLSAPVEKPHLPHRECLDVLPVLADAKEPS